MKIPRALATILTASIGLSAAHAQTPSFDLNAYRQFLTESSTLQGAQLLTLYSAGKFESAIPFQVSPPSYLDRINAQFSLTQFEREKIGTNGFVVSSRLAKPTFISAFADVYHKDLPVFISTDAILQAIHNSYDRILMDVEKTLLCPPLGLLRASMRDQLPVLEQRYGGDPRMARILRDVDTYLTIPLNLLGTPVSAHFADNQQWVETLLQDIKGAQPINIPLFAETCRLFDFSQFTVRGHYTQDSVLARYFQAMIWLGRTEIYLTAPKGTINIWPEADIQRQLIDATLIAEAARDAGVLPSIQKIDRTLRFLVGESDNVVVDSILALNQEAGLLSPVELLDTTRSREYQTLLLQKPYSGQKIISQILMTDPSKPEQAVPASAFLLLGQRFVIDSFISGNVVYDRIIFEGAKVRRMLPSTLDILFALGNSAAAQLLQDELGTYHYAPNLAALRYLVDSYGEEYWKASMFNAWLQIIRTLNPPATRAAIPPFMQTAAWWQEKMNTQLGSWAQLRHDNLLYAKQSYTVGIICSYPEGYVEPIPAFFDAVKTFAEIARAEFAQMNASDVAAYFESLGHTADILGSIARKELSGTPISADERSFLCTTLVASGMCGDPYTGWYPGLFYRKYFVPNDTDFKTDFVVADVHTAPTDADGNPVGWVLHVGTGPVDLAIITAPVPEGFTCAFVGPVMNYYEHLSTAFKRLTDEEWATVYNAAPSLRPPLVNTYLANETGAPRGAGPSLFTGVDGRGRETFAAAPVLNQNYPNPFNSSTLITFALPAGKQTERVMLEIYDLQGRSIAMLLDEPLPGGNYTVFWEGTNSAGRSVASGIYFCRLKSGTNQLTRKLTLIR
jgi:hypothetical protein